MKKQAKHSIWIPIITFGIALLMLSCGNNQSSQQNTIEITSVNPDSGMVGDAVTIRSNGGFSAQASNNKVTFNGTAAPVNSVTPEEIVTEVPSGASSGVVKIEADGKSATGPYFKVLSSTTESPSISGVSPERAAHGARITIAGNNFLAGVVSKSSDSTGNAPKILSANTNGKRQLLFNEQESTGTITAKAEGNVTIYFDGVIAPVLSVTDTLLLTEVPEGAASGTIKVHSGDKSVTWDQFQLIMPLKITGLSPKDGPEGTSVTINGTGFSATPDSNLVTFNGTEAAVTSASTTELMVTVPQGATNGPVQVQVGEQAATGPNFTITEQTEPQVSIRSITPKTGPVGTDVTITGQNFSSTQTENIITFNGTEATVASASTTELTTTVPQGATSGAVIVVVDGQSATGPTFTVTENNAPKFTSAQTAYNSAENSTAVTTLVALDPDGDAVSYQISGGADSGKFVINANSGELGFATPPDYETPTDSDSNNTYEVEVQASDGDLNVTKNLQVTVTNTGEAPEFLGGRIEAGSNIYIAESPGFTFEALFDQTDLSTVSQFAIHIDESVDPLASASINGADAGLFSVQSINGGRTVILSGPTVDYSHSANGNDHQYEFTVTAQNGTGQTSSQTFIIPVKPFSGGDGSAANPYEVSNALQLQRVGQYLDSHFQQTQDIDATSTQNWNSGKGFDRIGYDYSNPFSGSYDGGGYRIMNLTINRSNTDNIGLFGVTVGGSEIIDVHLTGVNISGASNTGGLVGRNEATITRSSVSGSVTASESGSGGFVGGNWGDISDSYSTASVCCDSVGGFAGLNFGSIQRSYAAGSVSGTFSDGFLRTQGTSGTLSNSYWDTQATGQSGSAAGTGLTTSQMQGSAAETYMTGFDFTNVWRTNTGGYPTLR